MNGLGQSMKKVVPLLGFCAALGSMPAYGQQSCFPSKFGPEDQAGNLNHITPEKTRRASKLIKQGKSYALGIETNKTTPA